MYLSQFTNTTAAVYLCACLTWESSRSKPETRNRLSAMPEPVMLCFGNLQNPCRTFQNLLLKCRTLSILTVQHPYTNLIEPLKCWNRALIIIPMQYPYKALQRTLRIWEFPKIRGTLFWGPCNTDLQFRVLYQGPLSAETPIFVQPYSILIVLPPDTTCSGGPKGPRTSKSLLGTPSLLGLWVQGLGILGLLLWT